MKKMPIILICLIFGILLRSTAADNDKENLRGQIGLTFSAFGNNDIVNFQPPIGGPGYRGDGFITFGISYLHTLSRTFDFETGIEYSEYQIIVEPNLPLIYGGTVSHSKFALITIPAAIRLNFLKYFFLNGGLFLGIDMSNSSPIDRQNGLGANLGLGLKYSFRSISVFVNPYSKIHSLLPFTPAVHHQRLIESGFKFGVMFRMN